VEVGKNSELRLLCSGSVNRKVFHGEKGENKGFKKEFTGRSV
jgi:hypothetical protein